jgi:branched-chain amino acid transport system permease protein
VVTRTRTSTVASIVAVAVILGLAVLPLLAGRGFLQDMFFVLTMLALAQWWNLLAGYAGLVSVGQQAFVGIGGYMLFGGIILLGLDPITSVLAGGGTGNSLPPRSVNDAAFVEFIQELVGVRSAAHARDIGTYWMALVIAVATIAAVYWLLRSRQGLALTAIRDSERAASSVGVGAFRTRFLVYVAAALGTGLVGAVIYLQVGRISPDAAFNLVQWTARVIFIVVIGGLGTIEGPIVGVIVFWLLQDQLATFGTWYLILLGALAIVVMLFFPKGLWGTFADRFDIHLFPIRRRLVPVPAKEPS